MTAPEPLRSVPREGEPGPRDRRATAGFPYPQPSATAGTTGGRAGGRGTPGHQTERGDSEAVLNSRSTRLRRREDRRTRYQPGAAAGRCRKRVDLADLLAALGACTEAVEWSRGRSPAAAWRACQNGSWMLWEEYTAGRASLGDVRAAMPWDAVRDAEPTSEYHACVAAADAASSASCFFGAEASFAADAAAEAFGTRIWADPQEARTRALAACAREVRRLIPYRVISGWLAKEGRKRR